MVATACFDDGHAEPLHTQHGGSLRLLIETDEATRDFDSSDWELLPTRAGVGLSLRTVGTKTRSLTVDRQSGAGELYDMIADPWETTNLQHRPEYAGLRGILLCHIETHPDDAVRVRTQVGMS